MLKAAILLCLLAMLASLFSGLWFLVGERRRGRHLLTALYLRAGLAALALALIAWGLYSGQLVTHARW